jgi:hypothetical protein
MNSYKILPRTFEVPDSIPFPEIDYHKLKLFVVLLSISRQIPDTNTSSITAASFQAIFISFLINHPIIQLHISLVPEGIGK